MIVVSPREACTESAERMAEDQHADAVVDHRADGNRHFKDGDFSAAAEAYTQALAADVNNHELLSNRSGARYRSSRRREFCHFADTPWLSLLKHLLKVQGGCHQMAELSPTAL